MRSTPKHIGIRNTGRCRNGHPKSGPGSCKICRRINAQEYYRLRKEQGMKAKCAHGKTVMQRCPQCAAERKKAKMQRCPQCAAERKKAKMSST
jgi:hypothetical protein